MAHAQLLLHCAARMTSLWAMASSASTDPPRIVGRLSCRSELPEKQGRSTCDTSRSAIAKLAVWPRTLTTFDFKNTAASMKPLVRDLASGHFLSTRSGRKSRFCGRRTGTGQRTTLAIAIARRLIANGTPAHVL